MAGIPGKVNGKNGAFGGFDGVFWGAHGGFSGEMVFQFAE
jgi:hypothetical protein